MSAGRQPPHDIEVRIPVTSLRPGCVHTFEFHSRGWKNFGFVHWPEGAELAQVRGWLNRCAHLPFTLDLGDGDLLSDDGTEFICHNHGAIFDAEDGVCTEGPCEGQALSRLPLRVESESFVVDTSQVDPDRPYPPEYDDEDL